MDTLAQTQGRRFRQELAIELGSSHTALASSHHPHVLREPTLIALRTGSATARNNTLPQVYAIGRAALEERRPPTRRVDVVVPVVRGRLQNAAAMALLLAALKQRIAVSWLQRLAAATVGALVVSPGLDEQARAHLRAVLREVGLRRFMLIEAPLAAARGCGMDIAAPQGRMILDIGGGKSMLATFSMGTMVTWERIEFGGQDLDAALVRFVRQRCGVEIGPFAAADAKAAIGCVHPMPEPRHLELSGADPRGGRPKTVTVRDGELRDVLADACEPLVLGIQKGFETIPPELAGDILGAGVTLVGGGALLAGLPEFLWERTGVRFVLADDPLNATLLGAQAMLREELATRGWRRRMDL